MTDTEKIGESEVKTTEPTGKQVWILTLVLCLCAVGFIVLSAYDDAKIEKRGIVAISEDTGAQCQIGEVVVDEYISFRDCYAFIPGDSIDTWDIDVILADEVSGESVAIPTYMVETEEMKSYFAEGDATYNRVGFAANVKAARIDLSSHAYKVLLYYNNNDADQYIDTGCVLTEKGIVR